MAAINQELLNKLKTKLKIGQAQTYKRIDQVARDESLERSLAAILLAQRSGINVNKYVSPDDLSSIRGLKSASPGRAPAPIPTTVSTRRAAKPLELVVLDLGFISNADLRLMLIRDLAELNVARSQDLKTTSKICMVFAGAIVEALLLDCLQQREPAAQAYAATMPRRPNANIERWTLENMVDVAQGIGLLGSDTRAGATQMREWRNLIHPARALRAAANNKITPTPGRARLAISFLELVAEELEINCGTP
jgi:hypothetical protein